MNVNEKISQFVKNNMLIIIAVVVCILVTMISSFVVKVFNSQYENLSTTLSQLDNKISAMVVKEKNVIIKTRPFTSGLNRALKSGNNNDIGDDAFARDFLNDAFTFKNAKEYSDHRDKYIKELGMSHPFLTEIMIPYEAVYGEMHSEIGTINDGNNVNSRIIEFNPIVTHINDDGSYDYFVNLKRLQNGSNYIGHFNSNIAISYTIKRNVGPGGNVERELVNLSVATPSVKNRK